MIDPEHVDLSPVNVPLYPQPNEIVEFVSSHGQSIAVVNNIDDSTRTATGTLLRRVSGPHPRWICTRQSVEIPVMNIVQQVPLRRSGTCYYGTWRYMFACALPA